MARRPLLLLADPAPLGERAKLRGGGAAPHTPSRREQAQRLGPKLTALAHAMEARRMAMAGEVGAAPPEQVIVLETVVALDQLVTAMRSISGIEWLAEIDDPDIPADSHFFDPKKRGKPLHGRLYLTFVNQQALRELRSLWRQWTAGQELASGYSPFAKLFEHLKDVRPWDARDRLENSGVLADWRERVAAGEETVRCEIELWYRRAASQRATASERARAQVRDAGGTVLQHVTIEAIGYDAVLAELPIEEIERILHAPSTALVQCEDVHLFGAVGQMVAPRVPARGELEHAGFKHPRGRLREPVAALLDGLPLQEHERLSGRLVVDDPDGWEGEYPAAARVHGTAMASLILHGDLASGDAALDRRLYVRPIMRPHSPIRGSEERVPEDGLAVDLIHRAVRRMMEGEGDEPAVAPSVRVVNLSIGDRDRPFDRVMSPLARLLDHLAHRYALLFIVSAGNHSQALEIEHGGPLDAIPPDELQALTLAAVAKDTKRRRLLSPAEAMNVLTVAASHADASGPETPPGWVDPYSTPGMPSPVNGQGMGCRRCIKPDVLMPGGRVVMRKELARPNSDSALSLELYDYVRPPGVQVAAPGARPGERDGARRMRGTSAATALTTREAAKLVDGLAELGEGPHGEVIKSVPDALWLRAMLVHGAHWPCGAAVEDVLCTKENKRRYREHVTRLLGYGEIDIGQLGTCSEYRVTALGGGQLRAEAAHMHRFPLPPSLAGKTGWRRLTITLSYFTPINPFHQAWRCAHLWFEPPKQPLAVARAEADWQAVLRGTLQHEVLEGEKADVFVDGDSLAIRVSCRAQAEGFAEPVPYALAVTLEVAETIGVPIYDEIQQRIRPKVPVRP